MGRYSRTVRKVVIMATEAKKRANAKYDKEHTKGVYLKLNLETDKDILCKLDAVKNKQTYIKELIRKDIEKAP